MSAPLPPMPGLPALADHLACVVRGQSYRARQAATGVAASTTMRRVKRVAEARAHPDFDAVVVALERAQPADVTRETLAAALTLTPDSLQAAEERIAEMEAEGRAELLLGDMPVALVRTAYGEAQIDRRGALACLALGWLAPETLTSPARVRRFTLRRPPSAQKAARPDWRQPEAVERVRRLAQRFALEPEEIGAARTVVAMAGSTALRGDLERALAELPPRTAGVVRAVMLEGLGMEHAEADLGLPARSGKVLLADGLGALAVRLGAKGVA